MKMLKGDNEAGLLKLQEKELDMSNNECSDIDSLKKRIEKEKCKLFKAM